MRILRMTPYLTIDEYAGILKNSTGFGRTCWDLSSHWTKEDELYIQTLKSAKLPDSDNIKFLRYKLFNVIVNIKIKDLLKCLQFIKRYIKKDISFSKGIKYVIYFLRAYLAKQYFIKIIKKVNPDVIHIHGITPDSFAFIDAARESEKPYAINLHGVVTPTNFDYVFGNNWESNLLKIFSADSDNIIAISSGIFKYINESWNIRFDSKKAFVVVNGVNLNKKANYSIHEINKCRDSLLDGKKYKHILLNVGSITKDKGQFRIINSFIKLPEKVFLESLLIIIGDGPDRKRCEEFVLENKLSDHIKFLGYIPNNQLGIYYALADLFVLASEAPGFSRMYWESFAQGTPAIACVKQPGIDDIFSLESMVLANDFDTQSITNSILEGLSRKWDKSIISSRNDKFSWESRCSEYRKILYDISKEPTVKKNMVIDDMIQRSKHNEQE